MEEHFHLYGMKIIVDGDTRVARDRAYLARKLMYQTKLINTQGLDIIKGNLRLDDGTTVQVLSQHGFDSARIYVPPRHQEQHKEAERFREEVLFIPAWDAFDADRNHVGYVLARGEGWNGPYEFIPKTEADVSSDFEEGQYLENYSSMPFDSIDEYLKFKFIWTIKYGDPPIETLYFDVPPTGTINRIFDTNPEPPTATLEFTDTNAGDEYCATEISTNYWQISKLWMHETTRATTLTRTINFTMGPEGQTPGWHPDEWDNLTGWDGYNYETVYGGYKPLSTSLGFFSGGENYYGSGWINGWITLDSWTTSHVYYSEAEALAGAHSLTNEFYLLDVSSFPTWIRYIDGIIFGAECVSGEYEDVRETNMPGEYSSKYSSAEDSEHYGIYYDVFHQTLTRSGFKADGEGDLCPAKFDGCDDVDLSSTEDKYSTYHVAVSGETWDISSYGQPSYCTPRYFRVGETEFFLACFEYDETYRFLYISKGSETKFDMSVTFEEDSEESWGFKFPGVTDYNGNPLYGQMNMRIIQEIKKTIIKDE